MCGRFTLTVTMEKLRDFFPLFDIPDFKPRFNIAPTQMVLAVRIIGGRTRPLVEPLRWGLIPFWADDKKIGARLINARADTVASKPAFRAAFKSRRCLILADGFYEWQQLEDKKQPYHIRFQDRKPFALAGLWEKWDKKDEVVESCTIITTEANEVLSPLHDRMPVILQEDAFDPWLDLQFKDVTSLKALLKPFPGNEMESVPVSTMVNNARNESPLVLEA